MFFVPGTFVTFFFLFSDKNAAIVCPTAPTLQEDL